MELLTSQKMEEPHDDHDYPMPEEETDQEHPHNPQQAALVGPDIGAAARNDNSTDEEVQIRPGNAPVRVGNRLTRTLPKLEQLRAYSITKGLPKHKWLVKTAIAIVITMQLILFNDVYKDWQYYNKNLLYKYPNAFIPPWMLSAILRIITRLGLALSLSWVIWGQIVGNAEGFWTSYSRFVEAVKDPLQKVSALDTEVKDCIENVAFHLQTIDIKMLASLLQSIIFTITLAGFIDLKIMGLVDLVSFLLVLPTTGIAFSFYLTEAKIKYYMRKIRITTNGRGRHVRNTIKGRARAVEDCITERWYRLEIFFRCLSVIIPQILFMSLASQIPLSCCGQSLGQITQTTLAHWIICIVIILTGYLFSSNPYYISPLQFVGIVIQILGLGWLYWISENLHWGAYMHITYAVVPLSYLIWYQVMSMQMEWIAIGIKSQGDGNEVHVSRFFSRLGLLILCISSLMASIVTEYNHVSSFINQTATCEMSTVQE